MLIFFKYLFAEVHSAYMFNHNTVMCHWDWYFPLLVGCRENRKFDVYNSMHMTAFTGNLDSVLIAITPVDLSWWPL